MHTVCQKNLCTEEKKFKIWSSFKNFNNKIFTYFFYYCTHSITVLVYDHKAPIYTVYKVSKKSLNIETRIPKKKCRFFQNCCKRGKQDFSNKVIVLNATSVLLIFQYKNARKTSFKKYYIIGLFQFLQKKICERTSWYVLLENQNCI